jgi:hypothetical protein
MKVQSEDTPTIWNSEFSVVGSKKTILAFVSLQSLRILCEKPTEKPKDCLKD